MLSHFQPHFSNPRPDFAIREAMACRARTMGRNNRGPKRGCGSETATARRGDGDHRGINGQSGKRKGEGGHGRRPQTCADRVRHRGRHAGPGARRAAGRGRLPHVGAARHAHRRIKVDGLHACHGPLAGCLGVHHPPSLLGRADRALSEGQRRPMRRLAAHRHAEIPYRQRPPGLHHVVPVLRAHAADQHVQPVQRHARLSPRPHARHKLCETGRAGHRRGAYRARAHEQPASYGVPLLVRRPAVVGQLYVRPGVLGGARLDHHADRAVLRLLVRRCAQAAAQRVRALGPYRGRAGDVHGALHPAVPDRLEPCARIQHSADLLSRDSA